MRDYLNSEIEKRKAEIAKIDVEHDALAARRNILVVELRVYSEILTQAQTEDQAVVVRPQLAPISPPVTLAATEETTRTKLASHWLAVLHEAVRRYPKAVRYIEVGTIQRSAGHDPSPSTNIRSHIFKLVAEGLYERADRGKVRATAKAAALLGIPLGAQTATGSVTETPNSSELFGAPKTNGSAPLSP